VTTLPHKTLGSLPIESATDLEHCEFDGDTDVVLDKDEVRGVVIVTLSVLMVLYILINMIRLHGAWESVMMLLPPTSVKGWRKSQACQILPLLRTMKATEMAN